MTDNVPGQKPKHMNLAEAFQNTEFPRLDPVVTTTPETVPDDTAVVEAPSTGAPAAQPKPAKSPRKTTKTTTTAAPRDATTQEEPQQRGSGKEIADQPIQVSIPRSLDKRLREHKTSTGASFPNIIFDAIESTYDQLPGLIASKTLHSDAPRSLFERPVAVARRPEDNEPKETMIIRITKTNKQVLKDLEVEVKAPNRNTMIATALEAYLPKDNDER